MKRFALTASALLITSLSAAQTKPYVPTEQDVKAVAPAIEALYLDLHQHPELSQHESQTAAKLAARLKELGYEVTTGIGGTGFVGVMRNGTGPTVLLRTDLDALPVEEKTGLPYASKVTTKNDAGVSVPVMHACGHDIHMSSWIGTATLLAQHKNGWHGTLILVGQPAEELGKGARAMLADGLYEKFGKPTYAVALHDTNFVPAGQVSVVPGYALASSDSVDITVFGKGGHGSAPNLSLDPVVTAARIVLALQTIVSREMDPREPAVVTVGSIHGGTKHNIIPDEVRLQLTVRTYKDEVRKHVLASIERIAKAEAAAAGMPREPEIKVVESLNPTYNDPKLAARLASTMASVLGKQNVVEQPPIMGSEDFGEFGRDGVPAVIFWLGAANPQQFQQAKASGQALPSLHSALFAPDYKATLETGIRAETAAVANLLQ